MTAIRKIPQSDAAEWKARVELAATFRIANRLGWNEGIANHFSVQIAPDRYLLNPYELHFREITASNLLVVNGAGDVISGEGQVRRVAFYLHPRLHALLPRATAIIHAHPPYATAVTCVKNGRLDPAHAIAMFLAKHPDATPIDVRAALQNAVDRVPLMGGSTFHQDYGYGRLNVETLLA